MGNPQTAPTSALAGSPTSMLFCLPAELLLLIFTFVGFVNFRQDIRRLTVSKEWYPYARSILLSHLRLRIKDLLPILSAMRNSATQAAAQQLTKHIDLNVSAVGVYRIFGLGPRPRILEGLEQLASMLKDFTALRTLVIRSEHCFSKLPGHVVPSFASLSQLTSLEMDLLYIYFERDTHHHLCESISQLIPKLKSLRCRLPYICEKMLESHPGNLKELIISIAREPHRSITRYCQLRSLICGELQVTLEMLLLQFAASMHNPSMVRLIYDSTPFSWCTRYAFDAIEDRRLSLTQMSDWDEDGVPIPQDPEEGEDVESEESSDDEETQSEDDDEGMNQGDNNQEIFEDGEGEEE